MSMLQNDNDTKWQLLNANTELEGILSQSVFFETPIRIINYNIFQNWELAAWSQGFTICV